ncbi:uncharacterized protein LOC113208830 [Frankliniella occidentalis]|uniref:Uncharacterized protein LOC113208830 n=1 Tax=Frankliniella occidentalis TaxID=133901 RepID=A0A6J1SM47_FRAOC|nr:uncharacterized protein LOC113208830 [Frankliniella occidentalis]
MEGDDRVDTEQTLNYDFNFNMVLAKTLISKLGLPQERQLATEWLQKLSTSGTSMEELQLRNMFAYFLVLSLQEGQLRPPFDTEPPAAPLPSLQHLLVWPIASSSQYSADRDRGSL